MTRAAIHEAGHAVVGLYYGWKLQSARIANGEGLVRWVGSELSEILPPEETLDICFAGWHAELRHREFSLAEIHKVILHCIANWPESVETGGDLFHAWRAARQLAVERVIQSVKDDTTVLELEDTVLENAITKELKCSEQRVAAIFDRHWTELLAVAALLQQNEYRVVKRAAIKPLVKRICEDYAARSKSEPEKTKLYRRIFGKP